MLAAEPVEEKPDAKLETKAETKPEEKKPEAEKSVEGEKKPEIEAPLPTYEAFKLPENFKADDKALGEFSGLLGQLEIAKGDHKATQEVGQKLIDLFTSKLGEATTQMTDYYAQVHQQQVKGWQEELQKDPVLGGSGDRTVLEKNTREMARFLAKNAGTKEEVTAFRALMTQTGVGDAPALVRVINNLKAKIDRYENESAKMLPGTKPVPSVSADPGKGIMQKLYGKK